MDDSDEVWIYGEDECLAYLRQVYEQLPSGLIQQLRK
jgi:hypothetical protein